MLAGILCIWSIGAQNEAQLSVDEPAYNFGTIEESGGPVSHVFVVRNTGKAPLVITRVTASCGCTQPEYSEEPVAPGKTAELKVTFNPQGRPGPFTKTIFIYSNGRKQGSYMLIIRGDVKPKTPQPVFVYPYSIGGLKLHTKTVLFSTVRPEETLGEHIHLMNDTQGPLTVRLDKSPDYITAEMSSSTLEAGQTGEITVLLDGKEVKRKGRVTLELPVTVTAANEEEVTGQIQIAANIIDNFSKLSASDKAHAPEAHLPGTLLEFGQLPAGKSILPFKGRAVVSFDITNTGKSPLLIYSVTSDDERLDISGGKRELKPGATATFKVSLHPKDVKTKLESLVNVVCNDPNGPVRLIKVTAYK
jgi:hypothetical protein